tara:strand:- start:382 stop:969 length:588 start_codon:yes stop_codon:yes gene_type:complete
LEIKEKEAPTRVLISDKRSFETLFHAHYSELCSYAFHFLKDHPASEEIVQDLFVKLWAKKDDLKISSSIRSYLFQSTKNRCLNVIKHIEIRENYKHINKETRDGQESNAGQEMETKELEDKIEGLISRLAPERQKIFRMSRFEDLKYREIAEKLGISIKTVENQMGKALKFLRDELADYLPIFLLCVLSNWKNLF